LTIKFAPLEILPQKNLKPEPIPGPLVFLLFYPSLSDCQRSIPAICRKPKAHL
jgi:hypothetical protein